MSSTAFLFFIAFALMSPSSGHECAYRNMDQCHAACLGPTRRSWSLFSALSDECCVFCPPIPKIDKIECLAWCETNMKLYNLQCTKKCTGKHGGL